MVLGVATTKPPLGAGFVVVALSLNREVIETVAVARDETTLGTILTIPILKITKRAIIAAIATILTKVRIGVDVVGSIYLHYITSWGFVNYTECAILVYTFQPMTIKIYSTPSCTYCHAAKEFFKEKKVKFTDVDVASNIEERKEMIQKSGQMGVPVIEIDEQVIVGFNRELLEKKITAGAVVA